MKKSILVIAACLFFNKIYSQKTTLTGSVAEANGSPLPGATAILLEKKDSVMAAFALTSDGGFFEIKGVAPGTYLLQISYLGFEASWRPVEVAPGDKAVMDLGKITLSANAATLQAVEILGERDPVGMSRDTIDYNAAAFKVRPSDAVEDLLKKLPGIEVERDGTVKAHGQKVENVLVDGKEFFGKDTRIATKNLPADAVDRVQVFDKKSDMAEFTGIDDGQDERTINLKLKPGKKAGYFGKADGGGGIDEHQAGRFSGRANVNRFSPKSRLSAIGMGNNTNEQGFSFDEYLDFMGGIGAFMTGGGRVEIGADEAGGLPIGDGSPVAGIQTSAAGGLNWNRDFSKRTEATGSYFFNHLENRLLSESRQDNFFADGTFSTADDERRDSRSTAHRLNFSMKSKLDSSQRLTLRADAGWNGADLTSRAAAQTFAPGGVLENGNDRLFSSDGTGWHARASAVYKKRFGRQGRAFVASLSGKTSGRDDGARLQSANIFYKTGQPADSLRQRQKTGNDGLQYGLNLAWTEPLGRRQYLKLDAGRDNLSDERAKDFFDITGAVEVRNPLISNEFRRGLVRDRAGAAYLLNRKKLNLTAALALQNSRLEGELTDATGTPSKRDFARLLPAVFFEKEFRQANRLNLDYTTSVREPSLEELQPVADNSDPLNIFSGNPALRPEYAHELRAGYFLYDAFSFTTFFAGLNGSFTKDKIGQSTTVDDLLRRTSMPVNTPHEWRARGNFSFSTPIRPLKISMKIKASSAFSRGFQFVNSEKGEVTRRRDAADFSIENRKKQLIDVLLGVRVAHNRARFSGSPAAGRDYTDTGIYSELALSPNDNWLFDTKFEGTRFSAETFGERRFVPLWQAGLTRYFLKDKKGRLRFSAVNILGQNLGIRRSSEANFIRQESANTVGRYFLLSFGYSLSGFEKDKGGIEIKVGD